MTADRPQVDFGLGHGPVDVEILGIEREGVRVRTLTAAPGSSLIVPVAWITGYRPQDRPELNHYVPAEREHFRLTVAQHAVLNALRAAGDVGMTDDEHELINGYRADSAGKRRLELQTQGFVEPTGKSRQTRRGGGAGVYRITQLGRDALVAHDAALVAV